MRRLQPGLRRVGRHVGCRNDQGDSWRVGKGGIGVLTVERKGRGQGNDLGP